MVATRWLLPALLIALLLLGGNALGRAEPSPGQAVSVDLCVAEQDVKQVARRVQEPVFKALKVVPGTSTVSNLTTHNSTQFLVRFRDGATRNDRAVVEEALKRVSFAPEVEILSIGVRLAQPLADGSFPGRPACTEHLRRRR